MNYVIILLIYFYNNVKDEKSFKLKLEGFYNPPEFKNQDTLHNSEENFLN